MYSIGYGHQIQPNERYLLTAVLSVQDALNLFRTNLSPIEAIINSKSENDLTQDQFDALVDFGFNCGDGALANIISTWNATGDPEQVADRMELYNKTRTNGVLTVSDALKARRATEANMFIAGAEAVGDILGSAAGPVAVLVCVFLFYALFKA